MSQTRRQSLFESAVGTAIGFGIAFAANAVVLPLFGFATTLGQNFWITTIFTAISVIRGYLLRRMFNWLHEERT